MTARLRAPRRDRPAGLFPRALSTAALLLLSGAIPARAHGEQILGILAADVALCVGFAVVSSLWREGWRAKLFVFASLAAGIVATHVLPFFPNTMAETARYDPALLFVMFGLPPLATTALGYLTIFYWRRRGRPAGRRARGVPRG